MRQAIRKLSIVGACSKGITVGDAETGGEVDASSCSYVKRPQLSVFLAMRRVRVTECDDVFIAVMTNIGLTA